MSGAWDLSARRYAGATTWCSRPSLGPASRCADAMACCSGPPLHSSTSFCAWLPDSVPAYRRARLAACRACTEAAVGGGRGGPQWEIFSGRPSVVLPLSLSPLLSWPMSHPTPCAHAGRVEPETRIRDAGPSSPRSPHPLSPHQQLPPLSAASSFSSSPNHVSYLGQPSTHAQPQGAGSPHLHHTQPHHSQQAAPHRRHPSSSSFSSEVPYSARRAARAPLM